MTRFEIFAARDGETFRATIEAEDDEAATAAARPAIAERFQLQEELASAIEDDDLLAFDAELDGLSVEADELPNTPPAGSAALQLVQQIARLALATETECGQCEGTGSCQSMSDLSEEPCPVCDGSGQIDGGPIEEGAGEALDGLIERARAIAGESSSPYSPELAEAFRQGARELQIDRLDIAPGAIVEEAAGGGGAFVRCRVYVSDGERLAMAGEELQGEPIVAAASCNRNGHHRGPCSHRCNPAIPARA